jgi:hypothetical protein
LRMDISCLVVLVRRRQHAYDPARRDNAGHPAGQPQLGQAEL